MSEFAMIPTIPTMGSPNITSIGVGGMGGIPLVDTLKSDHVLVNAGATIGDTFWQRPTAKVASPKHPCA